MTFFTRYRAGEQQIASANSGFVRSFNLNSVTYYMRVTVTHDKGLQGAKKLVDDSASEVFKGTPGVPIQIIDQQKRWEGDTMHFSFTGKMGFFTAPLKGWVLVTEKDVTIECELPGFLKQFMPEEKVRAQIETRVKGLLT